MRTAQFDYELPPELIAQAPLPERDQSRLLVLDRATRLLDHRHFRDLPCLLRRGDLLVLNDSKVIPARLGARKTGSGGHLEVLLLEEVRANDWWAMLRPAKRVRAGSRLSIINPAGSPTEVEATVVDKNSEGHCRLNFTGVPDLRTQLDSLGEVPLPPYITRPPNSGTVDDRTRYQTIYARPPGSVAAPTAGLHFTAALLEMLRQAGIEICFVTLHVGAGTFAPVKTATVEAHTMHAERFDVSPDTAARINEAKAAGRRVVAVGTTTVRVLESPATQHQAGLVAASGQTRLFVYPPYQFRIVDALLTNFHLPRSTLLMLVCAFAAPGELTGRDWILSAYIQAIQQRYRFYSYGDAMLIL